MRAAFCPAESMTGLKAPRPRDGSDVHPWAIRLDAWVGALDTREPAHLLLVLLCFAALVPILYIARSADGNALTSWRWTFTGARVLRSMLVLVAAMLVALTISRIRLRGRLLSALVPCAAGAAVIPLWSEPELVLDSARYLVQAKFVVEHGIAYFLREWGRGIDAWTDLPLVPFLYGLVFSIAGESRACAQALDTLLFAATSLVTLQIGKMLWGEDAGSDAAVLLLGIPFLLVQVPLLLVDVPAMFFLTLSAWAFLWTAQKGGALPVAACSLAAGAAALAKYSLWPMLLVVAAGSTAAATDRRRAFPRTLAALLLACLLVAAAVAARPEVFERQARLLASFQWSGLGRWQEGFLSTFLFQTHPFVTALALFGGARALAARDARFLFAGGSLLLALALGSVRARYVVPLFPLVALAGSYGLAAMRDGGTRRFVGLCVAASSLVVAYGAYLPFLRGTSLANLTRAGEYLDRLEGPVIEVHALPQRLSSGSTFAAIPLLGYATRKRIACPEEWPVVGDHPAVRASSLRFSWEMRRPPFYAAGATYAGAPVVVISGEALGETPPAPSLRERARFAATSDVFKYQTFVTVYARDPGS